MVTIMTSVDATTIRVTSTALPLYGVSSSFRNCQNQLAGLSTVGLFLTARCSARTEGANPGSTNTDRGSKRCIDEPQNRFAPGVLRAYGCHNHNHRCCN